MGNTFITPTVIAREAVMLLVENLVASSLPYRDETATFTAAKRGDTVQIKKPATFTAQEFTAAIVPQDAVQSKVDVTIEKHFDVSFEVGVKERTLSIEDFSKDLIAPASSAIAKGFNAYIISKYKGFYLHTTGAFPTTIAGLSKITEIMDVGLFPLESRKAVISPSAKSKLISIAEFHNASIRGELARGSLQEAQIGRAMGIDWSMDQQIATHTAGTFSSGTPSTNGAVLAGATTMNITGGAGTETLKEGDLFTVADAAGQYVFTADKTATAGAITGATFYPAAPVGGFLTGKAITILASHKNNVAMHPNAIALATPPLALPSGAAQAAHATYKGLTIRVVMGYNITSKIETCSLDILAGAKVIQPELGLRIPE